LNLFAKLIVKNATQSVKEVGRISGT
jgi:hypothetical protein